MIRAFLIYKRITMYKINSLLKVFVAYTVAIFFSILFVSSLDVNPIYKVLYADIIATIIIYLFSYYYSNSSIYDPYWSIIPPFILLYFMYSSNIYNISSFIIMFSVLFWSLRLTFNWIRGWTGLDHEDWRYIDMRNYSKKYFQFSNFLGIHLFPTLIVYICCIPMKSALNKQFYNFSFVIGFILCFIGVIYEIISDQQLYKFKKNNKNKIIDKGLWKYSRHPNYYGEILFWWGLFFYGATPENFHVLIFAPISMTIMFIYVSIPWIENKILRTRPEYKDYRKKVSMLMPEVLFIKENFFNKS